MSLLLLFGGGSSAPTPVDPETTPDRERYDLSGRRYYDLDARVTYRPDNRGSYET